MGQNFNVNVAQNPARQYAPVQLDASGNLLIGGGSATALNVTTTTVIKASAGRICKVIFNAASTSAPGVYDANTTGGAVAAAEIWVGGTTTAAQTIVSIDAPCANGIVVVPGGATVAVIFD